MQDPFDILIKSSAVDFKSIKSMLGALHSGAKGLHAESRINHANKIIKNYSGNTGMGWRVNKAEKALEKYTPKQTQYNQAYDDYAAALSPEKQKLMNAGRSALVTVYDVPKLLVNHPASRTGMLGSLGLYTGAGLVGLNIDPYSRAGQLHGLSNAKDIATQYGTQGGYQAANDMINQFDSMGMRDRLRFAQNPNIISEAIPAAATEQPTSRFSLSKFLKGTPDMLDGAIHTGIADQINNFKM